MLQNAPFKFAPEDGVAYFEGLGWRVVEAESAFVAAHELGPLHVAFERASEELGREVRNLHGNHGRDTTRDLRAAALLTR